MKLEVPVIELRDPKTLVPYVKNAKVHDAEQVTRLAGQISAFGFDQPIVIDKHNVIIKGHGRREAALQLNLDQVPVIVSTLDEYEAMAARIGDNAVPSKVYNMEVLKFDLGTLQNKGMNMSLTGLTPLELKPLLPTMNINKQISPASPSPYAGSEQEAPPPGEVTHLTPEEYEARSSMPTETDPDETPSHSPEMESTNGDMETSPHAPVEVKKSEGYFMDREPIIQYNIVFDDKEQQQTFLDFVKSLKARYPEVDTIAGRVVQFIKDNSAASEPAAFTD